MLFPFIIFGTLIFGGLLYVLMRLIVRIPNRAAWCAIGLGLLVCLKYPAVIVFLFYPIPLVCGVLAARAGEDWLLKLRKPGVAWQDRATFVAVAAILFAIAAYGLDRFKYDGYEKLQRLRIDEQRQVVIWTEIFSDYGIPYYYSVVDQHGTSQKKYFNGDTSGTVIEFALLKNRDASLTAIVDSKHPEIVLAIVANGDEDEIDNGPLLKRLVTETGLPLVPGDSLQGDFVDRTGRRLP